MGRPVQLISLASSPHLVAQICFIEHLQLAPNQGVVRIVPLVLQAIFLALKTTELGMKGCEEYQAKLYKGEVRQRTSNDQGVEI